MFALFKNWYLRNFSAPGTNELALLLAGIFIVVYFFMWLVGPIVVAVCLAYCLDWFVRQLERRGISRKWGSALVMLLFVGLAVGVMLFLVPRVVKQGTEFYQNLELYTQDNGSDEPASGTKLPESLTIVPEIKDLDTAATAEATGHISPEVAEHPADSAGAPHPGGSAQESGSLSGAAHFDLTLARKIYSLAENLPDFLYSMVSLDALVAYVKAARSALVSNAAGIIRTQIVPSVANVANVLLYLVIVPIFMFLMLVDKEALQRRFVAYVLPTESRLILKMWQHVNQVFESYIMGSVLHIIITGAVNCVLFFSFGLNYALLLGVGMGLSVVIPYVGAVVAGVPVVLVALFQFGWGSMFIWLMVVYLVVQMLDSYALTPLLFSKTMDLDALSILVAIFVFGGLLGFWGVFFAIPLATFIKTLLEQWPRTPLPEQATAKRA